MLIAFTAVEVHITMREGYDQSNSIKFEAVKPAFLADWFVLLFGCVYGVCWALSNVLGQASIFNSNFGKSEVNEVLAVGFRGAPIVLYLAQALFLIRSLILTGRYYLAATTAESSESVMSLQLSVVSTLAVSFAILSDWIVEGLIAVGTLVQCALVTVCFVLVAYAIDWVMLVGERSVLGPRNA